MLIELSIGNFRSIKNIQTLNVAAAPITSKDKKVDEENVFDSGVGVKLLKSLALYGANGSGKSNIIRGFISMLFFIRDSLASEDAGNKLYEPFLLDSTSKNKPTFYQVVFVLDKKIFRYGFELKNSKVISEWLFGTGNKNEVYFFKREKNSIRVNKKNFPEGIGLEEKTKETTLFLNVVNAFNGKVSKKIKDFFGQSLIVGSGLSDTGVRSISIRKIGNEKQKEEMLNFLGFVDLGIKNLRIHELDEKDLPPNIIEESKKKQDKNKKYRLLLSEREVYNAKGKAIGTLETVFDDIESEGTKKYFALAGVILESLSKGITLIIDEFDARFHPLITKRIVQLYNSNVTNKNKAQLIFVTHDTNLLDPTLLRRDQIYFAEKNAKGESEYYSLVNVGGVRNDASFEKDYIKGKYGAIPYIGEFKFQ